MAGKPLTPFQERICDAAKRLLITTPLIRLGWKPEGPIGMSNSQRNKVFIVHFKGQSNVGFLTAHVWFDDVDEAKGTFKIRSQVTFAGRSGEPAGGEGEDCAQIFWGSLGFTYPL